MNAKFTILSALALALAAAPPASAATTYVIDVVMPLTGGAAFLGKGEQQSLQIAEKVINATGGIRGEPLQLVFHDDESNPQTSVQLTTGLLGKKPAVLLGSSLVASCRAMAPLMAEGPVEYCFSPGIHPEPGYVFSASVSTLDEIDAMVRYLRLKGLKRVALMFSSDATGQDAENGVKGALALPDNKDMQITTTVHFNINDVSVTAQLEDVKASNPQVFIAWSTGTPIATIFQGIVQTGLDVPVVTTGGNMTYAQMKQYAAFLPKHLLIAAPNWVVTDNEEIPPGVVQAHKVYFDAFAAAGIKPDQSSDLPWDATMTVATALRKFGPGATAKEVHDFIASQTALPGVDGLYNFVKVPQRGLGVLDSAVTEWSTTAQTWLAVSKPGGVPLH